MKTKLLILSVGFLLTTACQETGSGDGSGNNKGQTDKSSVSAFSTGACSPKDLMVKGHGTASAGETVRYRLNQNCDGDVAWKMNPSEETPALEAKKIMTKFEHEGQWVAVANVVTKNSPAPVEVSTLTVVSSELTLSGPQIGMAELVHNFQLVVPAAMSVGSISWNFGDGTPAVTGPGPKDHTFYQAGNFTVTVTVTETGGAVHTLTHDVRVLPPTDGMECVRDLVISGPSKLEIGQSGTFTAFVPQCLAWRVRQVRWNFGDGTLMMVGNNLTHSYDAAGNYTIRVDLFSGESSTPLLTITRQITVVAPNTEDPDPVPNPEPEPEEPEEPEEPGNPGVCTPGEQRTSMSESFTEQKECGVMGMQTDTYRNRIVEECKLVGGEVLRWVEVSRTKELVSAGQCSGEACELPPGALDGVDATSGGFFLVNGKWYLPNNVTKTFYSSRTPIGSCQEVAETRTCSNGVFSGSTSHNYLSCNNGCPGTGPHGTVITDIVTGQETVAKQCKFGETGITDIYQTLSDKRCDNGTTIVSNERRGGLITAGECPTYTWTPTELWSTCTADCGGEQRQMFECRNSKGEVSPLDRCEGMAPVVSRQCDANPEAVRREDVSSRVESAGQTGSCPADQIGYTLKKREITTKTVFACINHQVQQESSRETTGPWVEEKYCKDYAPHRCSKDPMTETESKGRYQWMKKCAPTVPMIADFLRQYDYYNGGSKGQLTHRGNIIYGSFMNGSTKPETLWKAPKTQSASCAIPDGVYIAAICVVDCATPEQQVMVSGGDFKKLEYVRFENAWNEKFQYVASLNANAKLSSNSVRKTPVDQWMAGGEEEHVILNFKMASGRSLRVTEGHAVVSAEGIMKEAREFKAGDSLVQLGGSLDRIVSITHENYRGRVFNVFVKSSEQKHNIVMLNGYLTGTAYFAGEGIAHLNRQVLRTSLTRGVFDW